MMKEPDIRPEQFYHDALAVSQADLEYFLLRHSDEFIQISCPACESTHSHFLFDKLGISYDACRDCNTMFVNPRPSQKLLGAFLSKLRNLQILEQACFSRNRKCTATACLPPSRGKVDDVLSKV